MLRRRRAKKADRPRLPNGKLQPWQPWLTCSACAVAAVAYWHPNQLRHNFATLARRQYGLEAAQVALGHSRADVTQVYAERDLTLAPQKSPRKWDRITRHAAAGSHDPAARCRPHLLQWVPAGAGSGGTHWRNSCPHCASRLGRTGKNFYRPAQRPNRTTRRRAAMWTLRGDYRAGHRRPSGANPVAPNSEGEKSARIPTVQTHHAGGEWDGMGTRVVRDCAAGYEIGMAVEGR